MNQNGWILVLRKSTNSRFKEHQNTIDDVFSLSKRAYWYLKIWRTVKSPLCCCAAKQIRLFGISEK